MGTASEVTSPLAGRIVAAGAASRAAVAKLLGLDGLTAPLGVCAVAWMDHAMEVAVEVGAPAPAVLRIEGKTPESKGLVSTDRLNLYFRGARVPEKLSRRVEHFAAKSLATWTLEQLAELLASDPEIGAPAQPMPPSADEQDRPRSLLDTWGDTDAYADFFAGGELARVLAAGGEAGKVVFSGVGKTADEMRQALAAIPGARITARIGLTKYNVDMPYYKDTFIPKESQSNKTRSVVVF